MYSERLKGYIIEDRLKGNIPTAEAVNYYMTNEGMGTCEECIFAKTEGDTTWCSLIDIEVMKEGVCSVHTSSNTQEAVVIVKEKLKGLIEDNKVYRVLKAIYKDEIEKEEEEDNGIEDIEEGIYPFEYAFSQEGMIDIPVGKKGEVNIEEWIGRKIKVNGEDKGESTDAYIKGEIVFNRIPEEWLKGMREGYSITQGEEIEISQKYRKGEEVIIWKRNENQEL